MNRQIEIFTAGCGICDEKVSQVRAIACPSCDITVLDMHDEEVLSRARELGVRRIPAVVVDGKLFDCCVGGGCDEETLRAAGIGEPLA